MSSEFLKGKVFDDHEQWIKANPDKTLGHLKSRIDEAYEQCLDWPDPDQHVEDTDDIPEPLASELELWDNSDPLCTFECRQANFEEFVMELEELVEEMGAGCKVSTVFEDRLKTSPATA